MIKQDRDSIKSNLNEFELWFKLRVLEKTVNERIAILKFVISDCAKDSDKRLFSENLRKSELVKVRLSEAFEFLNKHRFLYLSTIDRLVDAVDKLNEDYNRIAKRSIEILIEMGEEIDFEIPKDLKLEEN